MHAFAELLTVVTPIQFQSLLITHRLFLLSCGISLPFVSDASKFSKVDGTCLLESGPARNAIWPPDVACLLEVPEDGIQFFPQPLLTEVPSFITQVRVSCTC